MRRFSSLFFCLLLLPGCQERERAPVYRGFGGGSTTGGSIKVGSGEECKQPGEVDTSGLCGSQVVPVIVEKPNLYFVMDVSGSMDAPIAGSQTKISAAKNALVSVASKLGHRIKYGLAVYPSEDDPGGGALLGCAPGTEVFETREGDLARCGDSSDRPVLTAFTDAVFALRASGGTPLSATLDAISPTLLALEGRTSVLLVTDGAPNCNAEAICEVDACIPSIEQHPVPSGQCDQDYNCCDPAAVQPEDEPYLSPPGALCVDAESSLAAVTELREAGITTYVIGVPGSESYADLMNQLAVAGGSARDGDRDYFDARDVEELQSALLQIGSEVAQSCEIELDEEPVEPDLLNVYLDADLLAADPGDGWVLEQDRVVLLGEACQRVKSGDVRQIQIVEGCRTIIK